MIGSSTEFSGTTRFEVRRRLGAGGMGVVYEVFDRETRGTVALKTLQRLNAEALYLFKNEFRALSDISHPNLIKLGELMGGEDGVWFFTMELVEGRDLVSHVRLPVEAHDATADTLRARFCFEEARLRDALAQLSRGLQALHAAGKVHRDIKPQNVLVTPQGRVVLLDFGLVTDAQASSATENGVVVGTPLYMAPEQASQGPVGPAADWYSVGVMLYEALTGRPPFVGSVWELLGKKMLESPRRPGELVPELPADLDQLCMALLSIDPALRPHGTEVSQRLRPDHASVATGRPPEPVRGATGVPGAPGQSPFVGRSRELGQLADLRERSAGQAVAVLVRGESGVGKSALVRRFLESVDTGTVVLSGRCYEQESVPYKAFDGVIDALSRHLLRIDPLDAGRLLPRARDAAALQRIFPVLRRVPALQRIQLGSESKSPHELRRQAFAALRELFVRLGEQRRVVLCIDDLQWADTDSMVLLEALLQTPDAPPLLLLATLRAGEPALPGEVHRLELGGLDPDDARALATALGAARSAVETVALEAKGHPLFIQELATRATPASTPRLDEMLWGRIAELEPTTLRLLQLVVLAGAPITQRAAALAAGLDPGAFSARISQLREARLVRTQGLRDDDAAEPYHDRVGETILGHTDDRARAPLHRRLAEALEATGVAAEHPELLIRHLELCGERLRAAHQAVRAAAAAESALAFEQAAERYASALRLGDFQREEARQLHERLGAALVCAGRGREAAEAYLEAARDGARSEALDLRRRAAEQLLLSGHVDQGMHVLGEVVGEVGTRLAATPRQALLSVLWRRLRLRLRGLGFREREPGEIAPTELARIDVFWSAAIGLSLIDTIRGGDFQVRNVLASLKAGEPYRIARALAVEATYLEATSARPSRRAARLLVTAEALATRLQHPHALGMVELNKGVCHYVRGRWRETLTVLDGATSLFRDRCTGVAWEMDNAQGFATWSLWYLGELAELCRRVPHLVVDAERRGDLFAVIALKANLSTSAWLVADDVSTAQRHVDDAHRRWGAVPGFQHQRYWMLLAQGMIDLYGGQPRRTLLRVAESWPALSRSLLLVLPFIRVQLSQLRAAAALAVAQHTDDARERAELLGVVARDARLLARTRVVGFAPMGLLLRAGSSALIGQPELAHRLLGEAALAFDAADMALHAAAARHRLGTLRGGDEGRRLVSEAEDWMRVQGVKAPERILDLVAPGFSRPGP